MADERKPQLARQLAANPLLHEILDDCRQTAIRKWESSTDKDAHLEAWAMIRGVNQLRKTIDTLISEAQK
jgi:hypothetical protein